MDNFWNHTFVLSCYVYWNTVEPRYFELSYLTNTPLCQTQTHCEGDIGVCGIVVLSHFLIVLQYFLSKTAVLRFHREQKYIVFLAFWAAVFGKNSNFVQYFGEESFLTTLVREGIFLEFQCGFRYLSWNLAVLQFWRPPNVPLHSPYPSFSVIYYWLSRTSCYLKLLSVFHFPWE